MAIEIPSIVDARGETIEGMVDYLLAGLLHVAPSTLSARYVDPKKEVVWHLRTNSTETVFHRSRALYFRTILARFGHHFMDGKLYGGEVEKELSYLSRDFTVAFKMSNSQPNGFWIEITATPNV